MLKLPKRLHPEFKRLNVKPEGRFVLDASNPIVDRLQHCFVVDGNNIVDVVTGKCFKTGNMVPKHGEFGRELKVTTDDLYLATFDIDRFDGTGDFTVVGRATSKNQGATADQAVVFNIGAKSGSYKGYARVLHATNGANFTLNNSGSYYFSTYSSFNTRATYVPGPNSADCVRKFNFAFQRKVNDLYGFIDGVETTHSVQTSKRDIFYGSGGEIQILQGQSTFQPSFSYLYVFTRALSPAEVKSLNDDPYQILKPANDLYYFPAAAGGGGAESHSGFLVSVGTANLISTGLKNCFGVSSSSNVSATSISALAQKFGVSASTNAADTNTSGFAHMLGYIISGAISQTSATGVKNEFVSKLGVLLSVNASNSAIAGFKSAFGTLSESQALQALVAGFKAAFSGISSTTGSVTTVSGAADDLIRLSGFAISSNATAAVVEGLKIALGAILISSAANSTNSGAKSAQGISASGTEATTQLLAFAHKAGVLISANEVNTLTVGYNPDSDNPVARTRATGVLPYYHLNGVLNTLQIAATL